MSPWRFQILVLRFIALWIMRTSLSLSNEKESESLLGDVKTEITRYEQATGVQTVPAGVKTKSGQVVSGG